MLLPLRTSPNVRPHVSRHTITLPRLAVLVTLSILLFLTYLRSAVRISIWGPFGKFAQPSPNQQQQQQQQQQDNLATTLSTLFEEFSPAASGAGPVTGGKKAGAEPGTWPPNETDDLLDILKMDPRQILAMRDAHSGFVQAIHDKMPEYNETTTTSSRGIVTVGGSKYNPSLMVSLRLLRRTGSDLPVEVFMPADEYEAELCDEYMPLLNAVCRTFPEPSTGGQGFRLAHYQFKIFAVLFSSFADVLWLDADNFPLHDVAPLFDAAAFQDTGLVTWPDLWQTTISPAYYLVAGVAAERVQARASTEAGQLLVSKRRHWRTLLLAAYYNYHGPDHYYALLCQGGAGIGDKETFVPAASAMGLPYYQVRAPPARLGHYKSNGMTGLGIHTFALMQHDLVRDYEITERLEKEAQIEAVLRRDQADSSNNTTTVTTTDEEDANKKKEKELAVYKGDVAPFFLHMSTPKWDAKHVFDHVGEYDLTRDRSMAPAAAYRDPPEAAAQIVGVERMVWEEARWVACHLEDVLGWWEGKRGDICANIEKYFDEVLDTDLGEELGLAESLVPKPYVS